MQNQVHQLKLFLVVLGGRKKGCNIELHDVRWVVGSCIENTFSSLRNDWIGDIRGLHIDSYFVVDYVDGYCINLIPQSTNDLILNHDYLYNKSQASRPFLWFVNLGGYYPNDLQEHHQFCLLVAESSSLAKQIARKRCTSSFTNRHIDDVKCIDQIRYLNPSLDINSFMTFNVDLGIDPLCRSKPMIPDWFGYRRIDICQSQNL